ncbi:glycine oxidase ThiO [Metabacillus sp. GX 13764]|uniref:glycine oxidase ThiO n=1 Tax=Metabacillus kandeliae TaxID=2900151 RepID=UPI001E643F2B|nr:glycine oxidase ThiO [Metabacillus kandeliae]MCD7035216.1 glycine oxidase ThiO [Metabacillus kandeliae]
MNKADIIIIGAGVIGCSAAYELAKRGYSVALLDKGEAGKEASSAAAGLLGVQAEWEKYDPLFDMARESRALFPKQSAELMEASGIDIGYEEKGIYKIAETPKKMERLRETALWQKEAGEEAIELSASELIQRERHFSHELSGAVYYRKDGHVHAPELTKAYLHAAIHHGAELFEYTAAEKILSAAGKTEGVQTSKGNFYSKAVIVTAGAWSTPLLTNFKDYKTFPVKGEMISLKTSAPLLKAPVFQHGFYIVPKREGRILVGATMKSDDWSKQVSAQSIYWLLEKAKSILPDIASASFEAAWAGLRPEAQQGSPYMEQHKEIKGLFVSAGHFRNGILLSPAAGKYIADLAEKRLAKEDDHASLH